MTRPQLILAACVADLLAGDPEWFPHPVRLMGAAITRGEAALRGPQHTARRDLATGALLTIGLVAGCYLIADTLLKAGYKRSAALGGVLELGLAWTCLAARSLHDEASAVLRVLDAGDLALARARLSRIVGRDTVDLDEAEICRAVIETVAESLSDGVLAPLFYMALGGVPLAVAYKAVNTLDSMIGHADERYFYFGKFAARLDDVANLVPARVTALAIVSAAALLPGCDPAASFASWRRDHAAHKSPNAGHPESAMAGALQVRLGGQNRYAGEEITTPFLGADLALASAESASRCLRVAALATVIGSLLAAFAALRVTRAGKR